MIHLNGHVQFPGPDGRGLEGGQSDSWLRRRSRGGEEGALGAGGVGAGAGSPGGGRIDVVALKSADKGQRAASPRSGDVAAIVEVVRCLDKKVRALWCAVCTATQL